MPAASAEKRARQRANKLSKSKSAAEPIAQATDIASPPATDSTPILQTSASPPLTSVDFETFVELADVEDILQFCDVVASTREGRNLKLLWDRAFKAGLDQGRTEEREFRDDSYTLRLALSTPLARDMTLLIIITR